MDLLQLLLAATALAESIGCPTVIWWLYESAWSVWP